MKKNKKNEQSTINIKSLPKSSAKSSAQRAKEYRERKKLKIKRYE